ncbi:hypothetical protein KCU95_g57, partial [Aureobasidium melanogenum]
MARLAVTLTSIVCRFEVSGLPTRYWPARNVSRALLTESSVIDCLTAGHCVSPGDVSSDTPSVSKSRWPPSLTRTERAGQTASSRYERPADPDLRRTRNND